MKPIYLIPLLLFQLALIPSQAQSEAKIPAILFYTGSEGLSPRWEDSVFQFLFRLGQEEGYHIRWDTEGEAFRSLDQLRQYACVIFGHQAAGLSLDPTQRHHLESYMLGDEKHSGGAYLGLHQAYQGKSLPQARRPWHWYLQLTRPNRSAFSLSEPATIPLQLEASAGNRSFHSSAISYQKELPHPLPHQGLRGGKVFVTYLGNDLHHYSRIDQGQAAVPQFVAHIREALAWTIDGANQSLSWQYLDLSTRTQLDRVQLSWQTSRPQAIAYFVVEHAAPGENWQALEQVAIQGQKGGAGHYNWQAKGLSRGQHFFRVLGVTSGGTLTYSSVAVVEMGLPPIQVELFPNPVQNLLHLKIAMESQIDCELWVETPLGQPLLKRDLALKNTQNDLPLNIAGLSPGLYQLKLKTRNGQVVKSFLKYE